MTREATDRIADEVNRAIRAEMIQGTELNLDRLRAAYERIAADISQQVQGTTSRVAIERMAREQLESVLSEVMPVVEANILAGAAAGVTAVPATFDAIFPNASAPRIATELEAQRAAAQTLRGRLTVDQIPLSRRIRTNHERVAREMAREIQTAVRAAESVSETAERILSVDTRAQDIPRYISDISEAARSGGDELRATVARYRSQINAQGSAGQGVSSIRAGTERLVRQLGSALPADVDGIVNRWVSDRAQAHSRMIARTETIRANRQAYTTIASQSPAVVGFKWNLSNSPRHKPDICDLLANQDLHGLGPGGYPTGELPPMPHPNDLCFQTAIIDEHHFDRQVARENGEPEPPRTWESGTQETADDWLRRQPESFQREVLGPTRQRMLNDDSAPSPIAPDGSIRRVRDLTGPGASAPRASQARASRATAAPTPAPRELTPAERRTQWAQGIRAGNDPLVDAYRRAGASAHKTRGRGAPMFGRRGMSDEMQQVFADHMAEAGFPVHYRVNWKGSGMRKLPKNVIGGLAYGRRPPANERLVFSSEPSFYVAFHERSHAIQFSEIGHEAMLAQSTYDAEAYVFRDIWRQRDLFSDEELQHARDYIDHVGRKQFRTRRATYADDLIAEVEAENAA